MVMFIDLDIIPYDDISLHKLFNNEDPQFSIYKNSLKTPYIQKPKLVKGREILIDWMIDVIFTVSHSPFKISILELAVNILDRYLYIRGVVKGSQLQLVGTTCMFIASKFHDCKEDVFEVLLLCEVTANSVTEDEIYEMEKDILTAIEYKIWIHTIPQYIDEQIKYSQYERWLCYAVLCYDMIQYDPKVIAAAIVYIITGNHTNNVSRSKVKYISKKLEQYKDTIVNGRVLQSIERLNLKNH